MPFPDNERDREAEMEFADTRMPLSRLGTP